MKEETLQYLITQIIDFCKTFGLRLIAAIAVLIIGFKLVKFLMSRMKKSKGMNMLDKGVQTFMLSCLGIVLKVLLLVTAASIIGLPMTSFITILGTAGVAIGLALQGSLSNIAGGVIILMVRPFAVGHYISTTGASGTVTEIGIFYTKLKTPQGLTIIVPNGDIIADTITNYSLNETRMVDLKFTAGYEADVDKVKEVMHGVALRIENILPDPAPDIKVTAHKDSAVEYQFRVWCASENYWQVYYDAQEQMKKAFDANAISIPYPQVDVHIKQAADN
ncbi:MAG: mechanosensitive ion channel [Clostridia bacterium]|nr:mechanosensitive ion channel [Clostridia bacterium]